MTIKEAKILLHFEGDCIIKVFGTNRNGKHFRKTFHCDIDFRDWYIDGLNDYKVTALKIGKCETGFPELKIYVTQ